MVSCRFSFKPIHWVIVGWCSSLERSDFFPELWRFAIGWSTYFFCIKLWPSIHMRISGTSRNIPIISPENISSENEAAHRSTFSSLSKTLPVTLRKRIPLVHVATRTLTPRPQMMGKPSMRVEMMPFRWYRWWFMMVYECLWWFMMVSRKSSQPVFFSMFFQVGDGNLLRCFEFSTLCSLDDQLRFIASSCSFSWGGLT